MALLSGKHLGPYEILSPLGAGGMGEVYKARDTRLNRLVAIKVLPAPVSDRPEVKQRFEREAQAIAALNHPNICVLHDIGHQDGVDYLVMEHLEGETLADRLNRGPLALEQALRVGIEIGDALDKAHRSGVLHRDVKPGNIMLTRSGAKLLDFGLAKLKSAGQAALPLSELPTALTAEGSLLGTLQYMAPEQLDGAEADARTDVFAFGAVLYEMATGRKAFSGKSQASLIASILSSEPAPVSSVQPLTPPALEHVVTRCLAKAPDARWTAMNDVVFQLKWIAERGPKAGVSEAVSSGPGRKRLSWAAASAALLALATLAVGLSYFRGSEREAQVIRFSVLPPPGTTFVSAGSEAILPVPALSPDGSNLAFVAFGTDGRQMLWLRPLGSLDARFLPGTEGASFPFWSPDSRFVGFFGQGSLKKIDVTGGLPQTLSDAPAGQGGTWNRDGLIVFAPTGAGPLYRVPASGGTPAQATELDKSHPGSHRWPHFLPDGRHFLYLARSAERQNRVFLGSIDSRESREVVASDSNAVYVPSGQLLFVREGTLMIQPFHVERLETTGQPAPVLEQVQYEFVSALAAFSVSQNDVLAYRTTSALTDFELAWFDRSGKRLSRVGEPGAYTVPQLSPDGRKLAVAVSADIWVADLARGSFSRLTFGSRRCCPVWSPKGDRIVFRVERGAAADLYQKLASGAGQEELLWKDDRENIATDWARDGRYIVFQATDPQTKHDLWALPTSGERKPIPLFHTEFNEAQGRVSPNGQWIAYTSDESGKPEVYVRSFPTASGKWPVSTAGGADPRWRADGKELYFISADRKLMAVSVEQRPGFEAGIPVPLFDVRVSGLTDVRSHYAASADGQRFLINTSIEDRTASPTAVVVNWSRLLGR
jgi:serine/threonine protein kinase